MGYKIPSDEEVVSAIQRVISKHHTINSQHLMKELVEKELASVDKAYRVSGFRIRKFVLNSKYFHLDIDYKLPPEADKKKVAKAKKPKKPKQKRPEPKLNACPVCGSKVKKIKNKTLRGDTVVSGFRCRECPYHTGLLDLW